MTYSGGGTVTLSGNNSFAAGSTALDGGTTLILSSPTFNAGHVYTGIGTACL